MTSLLTDAIRRAVTARTAFDTAGTFGLVALAVLLVALLERELLRSRRSGRHDVLLGAVGEPLLIVFLLATVARLATLIA